MPVVVQCPACGKAASVPENYVGQSVRCPQCRTKFKLVASAANRPSEAANEGPPADAWATVAPADPCIRTIAPDPQANKPMPAVPASGVPAQIGRFQVRAALGAGAFGAVYRAYDPQLDREVALKVPQAGTLDSPQCVERFLREARAAARLFHPHIIPVYEADCDGGRYYIASKFIDGQTLAAALDAGPLEPRKAARIVCDLAEALAHAHEQGVVHRDVKPANVMLDRKGQPHLTDFGLAHLQEKAEKLTQTGAILGTPAYMAPEQAAGRSGPRCRPRTSTAWGWCSTSCSAGRRRSADPRKSCC